MLAHIVHMYLVKLTSQPAQGPGCEGHMSTTILIALIVLGISLLLVGAHRRPAVAWQPIVIRVRRRHF